MLKPTLCPAPSRDPGHRTLRNLAERSAQSLGTKRPRGSLADTRRPAFTKLTDRRSAREGKAGSEPTTAGWPRCGLSSVWWLRGSRLQLALCVRGSLR